MRDVFPEVRERLQDEIDSARVGDRIVIITFGETVHLLARRRIRGPADRAYMRAVVQGLEPSERATYLSRGLDRAFVELREFFEVAPDRERRLLWLSDDKNNPPPSLGDNVFTLADLRREHEQFQPEGEWFAFDAPLAEGPGQDVAEFLQWARRSLFHVTVRETEVKLAAQTGPEFKQKITIHFEPQHSGLDGLEFLVLARVSDASTPGAPHVELTVEPSTVTVREGEWAQDFTLTYSGAPGRYTGFLVFESYARTNFRVEPERIPLSFTVREPIVVAEEPEKPEPTREEVLTEIAEDILKAERAPGAERTDRPLEFGPVRPGYSSTKVLPLTTNGPIPAELINLQADLDLPEGFEFSSEIRGEGTSFQARLTLRVSPTAVITEEQRFGGNIQGRITFTAADPNITVQPFFRQVLITMDLTQRWGRRMLTEAPPQDVTRAEAEQLGFEALGRPPEEQPSPVTQAMEIARTVAMSPYLWGVLLLLVLVIVLAMRFRPRKTAFYGELVVIKDPGTRKVRNVDLARVAAQSGHDALTIGANARADVRLQHESVQDQHARITTATLGEDTVIMLQPARGAELKVNDKVRTERVRLNDKDLIAIGDYIFLFSSPAPQRHVVVRFLDGGVLRGTPLQWDIAQDSFQLLLDDPTSEEEVAHVEFGDLKAVFFVQDLTAQGKGEAISPDRLNKNFELVVEFADGEKLEGYALNDYSEQARRFYVVPKNDPSVISVLVERANTKSVTERQPTGAPR